MAEDCLWPTDNIPPPETATQKRLFVPFRSPAIGNLSWNGIQIFPSMGNNGKGPMYSPRGSPSGCLGGAFARHKETNPPHVRKKFVSLHPEKTAIINLSDKWIA